MHKVDKRPKRERYKGLKPKLIHLDPKVFKMLNTVAKMKNLTLKTYIEEVCVKQAVFEAGEIHKALLSNQKP